MHRIAVVADVRIRPAAYHDAERRRGPEHGDSGCTQHRALTLVERRQADVARQRPTVPDAALAAEPTGPAGATEAVATACLPRGQKVVATWNAPPIARLIAADADRGA